MQPKLFTKEREEGLAAIEPVESAAFAQRATLGATALRTTAGPQESAVPRRPPRPSRPKGRLLIVGVLFASLGVCGFLIWDSFLRSDAYGTVQGRVVEISPPWSGTVEALYVQVGDEVKQGDIVATLQNPELEAAIERLSDETRLAQAELDAEVARLTVEAQLKADRRQQALANYYELAGELVAEQSKLDDMQSKLSRINELTNRNVVTGQEFDSIKFAETGQRAKLQRLQQAIAEVRKRVEAGKRPTEVDSRLKPRLARIEQIQAEIERLRERIRRGRIRSPIAGRVIAIRHDVGEFLEANDSVIAILRQGSTEVLIFVRQSQADRFVTGNHIDVVVEPYERPLRCCILRLGEEYQESPRNLETRYRHGEKLLPVYLKPCFNATDGVHLRLGSQVRVPYRWSPGDPAQVERVP